MLAATQSQIVPGGQPATSVVTTTPGLAQNLTWRLISDTDGSIMVAESSDSIVEVDDGREGLRRYQRTFTAPSAAGRYLAIWRLFSQEEQPQTFVVAASVEAAFATSADVAARLGRSLSSAETSNMPFLLHMAATVIADAVGFDDGWAVSLAPIPQRLRLLSVELVCRAMVNPSGYTSFSQQVGSYNISVAQAAPGMALSDAEVLMVRRAVHGRTTDSVHVESDLVRAQDEYWLRKQAGQLRMPDSPETTIA